MRNRRTWLRLIVALVLGLGISGLHADDTNRVHFYFVQISDIHFVAGENARRSREIVDCINGLPVDVECVALTGDIMADNIAKPPAVDKAQEILERLSPPLHVLPGNHDIRQKNLETTLTVYTNRFGPFISQAEYRGVTFIFLYTEPLARSFAVPGYDPVAELEAKLKEADGKPVIVFHHTPSVEDLYRNIMHPAWPAEARARWIRLLNSYNVKAVIAGHYHRGEMHWLGDVPLFVGEAVAHYWDRPAAFRLYEYDNGRLSYRTQYTK